MSKLAVPIGRHTSFQLQRPEEVLAPISNDRRRIGLPLVIENCKNIASS